MIFSAKRHVSFALLFLVVGGAIGFLGWHGQGEYGYALLLFGAVLLLARNAAHAFVFALGYYLLLSTETPPSLRGFFDYSLAASVGLWLAHGALNAVAWALPVAAWALLARFVSFPASMPAVLRAPRLVWTARALFVLLGGSILSVLEPWASFSWGHPLMVAGQMYPGGHWFALAAVLLIWIALGAWAQAALDSVGQPRPATRLARAALLLPLLLPIAILASMLVWRSLDLNQRPAAEGFAQSVVWHAQHSQFEPGRTPAQLMEILQRGSALPVPLQAGRLVDYEMTLDRAATQAAAGTIRIYKLSLEGDDGSTLQTTLRFWQASSFGSPGWWMRFPSITDLAPLPAPERPARRR